MGARTVVRGVGAVTASIAVLALAAGIVVADQAWPPPGPTAVEPLGVGSAATEVEYVCPGPPRLSAGGSGVDHDPAFDPAPEGTSTTTTLVSAGEDGGAPAQYLAALGTGDAVALQPEDAAVATASVRDVAGPGVLRADVTARAAGATVARTDAGDLRGLVGATCQEPATSAWIVAGSTDLGSSQRLVLDNAGATPATVAITLWGPGGPVNPDQARTVLVPAGAQRAVLLEAVAAEQARLAVRLDVRGGLVAAWVQDSALRGFVPAGVDLAVPTAEPARTVHVPAISLGPSEVDSPDPSVVRVVNPGDAAVDVELRLLGPDGEVTIPGAQDRLLEPGTVTDISLAGVPAGLYAAELVADGPIAAAALVTRIGRAGPDDPDQPVVDRGWSAATLAAERSLAVLPGVGSTADRAVVVVSNPAEEPVTAEVITVGADGGLATREVDVPARATVSLTPEQVAGAVAVEVVVAGDGDAGVDVAGLLVGTVVVVDAADGALVSVLGAQTERATSPTVAVRLHGR